MVRVFTQTTNAAQDGTFTACSGLSGVSAVGSRQIVEGGTAGTVAATLTINNPSGDGRAYHLQSEPATMAESWETGDWTVRINIASGNVDVTWEECYICRVDSGGTSQATIASVTGLGIQCTNVTSAIKTHTFSGVASNTRAGGDTDEIYIVFGFASGAPHGNDSWSITPDQDIDTPISDAAGVDVDLDGRTLCHGLTWTSPADFVNREATTRTLNLSTARATLSQQVPVTGRTTSVSTSRATLSQQLNATGRTTSITTSRATLSQEAGAVFNELTGRVLAGRAGHYTFVPSAVDVDLTGRTLCHGLTYSTPPVPAVTNDLESRTLGSATSRATLSQQIGLNSRVLAGASTRASLSQVVPAPSFSELTGRTLCHGLTYTSAAPAPEVDVDLTGRTTSLAQTRATLSQVVPAANVDLTGRTLCHGLTYSSGAVVPTTELTGRTACFSYPGGTTAAEAMVYNNLTARTLQASTTRATVTVQIGLQSRTLCIPTTRATLSQVVEMTGRVLNSSTSRATASQTAPGFNSLTGRTMGVAGYFTDPASFVTKDLDGRTLGRTYTRATADKLINLSARVFTPTTSRATLSQITFGAVNLQGRLLCLSTSQATQDFVPRTVDLDARILCLSGARFIGLLEPPPKIPGGQLRGIILSFRPIGETARPINPRGVTAGNLLVGESK